MTNITILNLDNEMQSRLQMRADHNGRSLEEEALAILRTVLIESSEKPLNLAKAIERRFAAFGDVEFPEISRDSLREIPNFEEFNDCH